MTHVAPRGVPATPLTGYFADPNLLVVDNRYYLFPTSDGIDDWGANSFSAFSSTDLVEWTDHGEILRLGEDVAWARRRAWAPAMAELDGRFYFYFTADFNIGVAVADSPTGPFEDLGRPIVAVGQFEGHAIDPAVFRDDDGTYYLYWGNGVAHGVRLAPDMTSFDTAAVTSWQLPEFREALWVHRRGDLYYASWSINDTRHEDYQVRYAVGTSPLGPWEDRGVLVEKDLERGIRATGHHSIARVPDTDEWVIAYHRFAMPSGDGFHREIVFERLVHGADGELSVESSSGSPLRIDLGAGGESR